MKAKKLIALLLVAALFLQLLPFDVFAEGKPTASAGVETAPGMPGTMIVGELTDRRSVNEKHFRMDDGSYIAVDYNAPVHFTADNGETWENIDNTLTPSRDGTNLYTSTNGDAARSFAANLRSGLLFTATDGNHSLRMGLAANNSSADGHADNAPAAENQNVDTENNTEDGSADLSEESAPSFNRAAAAEISYPDVKNRGMDDLSLAEQVTPAKLHAQILYQNVYENVDLQYELYGYNVKETILVNQPLDSCSFTFYMDAETLIPVLLEDGSIEFRNAGGEPVYLIPAPYMTDANEAYSDDVSYALEETASGSWALTVTADEDWINDPDRAFPVAIDPTIIDKVAWTAQGIGVTYVSEGHPNTTYTHNQNVDFGYMNYDYGKEHQVFIGWDTLPSIPAGSEVVNAQLYLCEYKYSSNGVPSIIGEVHAVTGSRPSTYSSNYNWICGLCWNTKPTVSGTVTDYVKMDSTLQFRNWDITELVKGWYSNSSTTRAACIKLANIENYSMSYYAAVTFRGYGHAYGPVFVVSYRDMTGVEPYYSYQSLGADRAGAAYISDYTGALTTVTPLVSYASTVNPFSLNLVYNSSYFVENDTQTKHIPSQMGYGFYMGSGAKLDLLQKVEYVDLQYEIESSGTKRYIKYTDGDGTAHYFATDPDKQANEPANSTTYYYDEDGLGLKITEYTTHYFRMEDDKGNKMYFVNGFLTLIQDANGNSINLRFRHSDGTMADNGYPNSSGDRLDHITQKNKNQAAITVASFQYDSTTNLLRSITDAAGNSYRFQYNGNQLKRIQRRLLDESDYQNYVEFGYSGAGFRMTCLEDKTSQYSLHLSYAAGRVSSFWEQSGSETGVGATVTRVLGEKTTYKDWGLDRENNTADDLSTTYLFDYAGRAVNAFSTDVNGTILGASNAVLSGTGNTDKQNNRTLRSAGIGMAGVSMVRNGGFELSGSGLDWTIVTPEDCGCFATVKSGELKRTGTKAFKTWVSDTATGPTGVRKSLGILNAGQTYSFSVYVNTSVSDTPGTKGIYMRVEDSWGAYWLSEYVNYKSDPAIDGGWVKLNFSFTAAHDSYHSISILDEGITGAVYYDDFQMETGNAPSNVNLLDNGGISTDAAGWLAESNAAASAASVTAIQGDKALKIIGSPKTDKYLHQTVSLKQPGTQTYVLSGWAKANAVPDNETPKKEDNEAEEHYRQRVAMDNNKQFGLRAVLTYEDNTTECHYVPFNADVTDWQFASLTIVPKKADQPVASIKVICTYEKNANTAYFDNLSLVKEVAQTMKYDEDGNLVSVQSSGTKEESSAYTNGNLTQVETAGSGTFDYTYDNHHNLTEASNGTVKESYEHDDMGNVTASHLKKAQGTITDANTIHSSKSYTNGGNLVETTTNANGNDTCFSYASDLNKMLGAASAATDAKGTTAATNLRSDGLVSSSWISSYVGVFRTYDSKNQLTRLDRSGYNVSANDPTGYHQYYNFEYDSFGNTTSISVGDTTTYDLGSYSYAPKDGLLTGMSYGNGATVSYTYDKFGRKVQTDTSSGDRYTYAYTGDGQLYQMKDVYGALLYRYTYDNLGRLINSSMKSGNDITLQTQHLYDDANRLSAQAWSMQGKSYRESYSYDESNGRLTGKSFTLPGNVSSNITVAYQTLNRLNNITSPVSINYYNYADAQNRVGTTGLVSGMSVNPVSGLSGPDVYGRLYYKFTYDELGNITRIQELAPDNSTIDDVTYTYDNQNQLTQAVSSAHGTWAYQYDAYGNIRAKTHGSDSISYTYGDTNWRDLLTAVSGTKNGNSFSGTYTYDGSGNPTSFFSVGDLSAWTMSWKNGRELATASNGTHTISYDYDVNGLRTYKIVDGVRHDYVYASGQLLRESYTENGTSYTLDFLYDQSGRPYILYLTTKVGSNPETSSPYYYLLNLQGDVVALVTASGTKVAAYSYDPYGALLTATGTLADLNPLRYRGYYYDAESGFYYLQSRYYDPALGRFLNADRYASTGQGFLGYNMFAYCENNPVCSIDASGDYPIWQALFEDSEYGFIHRAVQQHITEKYPGIRKERKIYNADGTLCGCADIYANDGSIWEVKTTKTGAEAAELQLSRYCGNGKTLGRNGPTTRRGESGIFPGRFSGSFSLVCGDDSYTVVYYTPQPGVVLYSAQKNKGQEMVPYAVYVPKRERSFYNVPRIGNTGIRVTAGILTIGAFAFGFGGGGYCFDRFSAFGY